MWGEESADDTDGLIEMSSTVGAGVVVGGPLNEMELFAVVGDGVEKTLGVAGRARIIGGVANHEERNGHAGPRRDRITTGVVDAPLAHPAS